MPYLTTVVRGETRVHSLPHSAATPQRLPIPETVGPWAHADQCDGSEEHVYATVLDLEVQALLDVKETESLNLSDPTASREFDRKSLARKAVRLHKSPLPSDSGRYAHNLGPLFHHMQIVLLNHGANTAMLMRLTQQLMRQTQQLMRKAHHCRKQLIWTVSPGMMSC